MYINRSCEIDILSSSFRNPDLSLRDDISWERAKIVSSILRDFSSNERISILIKFSTQFELIKSLEL